jgi:hypothetical protein
MGDKGILRVGVLNNFNFTDLEIKAVKALQLWGYDTFVNSNSHVYIDADAGPAVITINPDLDKFVEPHGDLRNVKAVRVKYVASPRPSVAVAWQESLDWARRSNIPVLVTLQRFVRRDTMNRYTNNAALYVMKDGYLRLETIPKELKGMSICDEQGKGCPTCQLCATLVFGRSGDIQGISLEESGICKFSCPDCFAKRCLRGRSPVLGRVAKNKKMEGHK